MERVYLLTDQEFVILAAASGIHKLYGFDMNAAKLEREDAIYALQALTEQGYVEVSGESFQLTGAMSDIFEQIAGAEAFMEIHKKSGRKCMLYLGKRAVRVAQSMCRSDTYELSEISYDDTWRLLQDEGWIPKESGEEVGKENDIG